LFIAVILACPIGLASQDSGSGSASIAPLIAVFGCVLVFFGALVGLQLYLITSGGPVLAAGPAGLWIKTRPTRGQAIWLPWEGIERIYRRRWSFEKMVCVKARDPRVGSNLGAFTAMDSSMQQLFFGSGFTATVNFADKPEQEIMAALTHFSAGRCPIACTGRHLLALIDEAAAQVVMLPPTIAKLTAATPAPLPPGFDRGQVSKGPVRTAAEGRRWTGNHGPTGPLSGSASNRWGRGRPWSGCRRCGRGA